MGLIGPLLSLRWVMTATMTANVGGWTESYAFRQRFDRYQPAANDALLLLSRSLLTDQSQFTLLAASQLALKAMAATAAPISSQSAFPACLTASSAHWGT